MPSGRSRHWDRVIAENALSSLVATRSICGFVEFVESQADSDAAHKGQEGCIGKFGAQLSINSDERKGRASQAVIEDFDFNIKRIVTNKRKPKGAAEVDKALAVIELSDEFKKTATLGNPRPKAIVKREEQILKLVTEYTVVDPLLRQRLLFLRYIQTRMAKLHSSMPDDKVEVVFNVPVQDPPQPPQNLDDWDMNED
uniref:Uncharacterized protein n=1 Tax=Ditylenchus dipsaci TaxID=166011 RepID=A0A915ELD6_9BILA